MSIGPQHNGGILGATNNPTSTSAGGIWTPVQHYQAQRDGLWPVATAPLPDYTISRSLRFNKTDSAALNYTPAIAGNRKTWILSTWVKSPGTFMTNDNPIFAVRPGATPYTLVTLRASNAGTAPSALLIEDNASGMVLSTAMVFRDYSAWYHIVVAVDTTQSVSTNRVKMFVNGVQITTFAGYTTYPNQNIDTQINSTNTHYIGRDPYDANNWYSGYLADFRFIDGYPSGIDGTSWNNAGSIINLFGETDLTTGVWKPKAYSGSYGTNGFYLPFTDNSTQNNLGVNTAQVGDELRNYTVLHLSGNPANTSGYNCFSDRSSNNHLLTASGDIPTSARSPFTDTTSGSAYFSNGSYLQIPASSALTLGTADYTVEGWFYFSNFNNQQLIGNISTGSDTSWAFYIQGSSLIFSNWGATAVSYATSNLSINTWYHLAVSRNNSLVKLFVNGNVVNSNTPVNQNYSSTQTVYIGDDVVHTALGAFTGYMSNLRVIKNQSILNNTFTPSSSPLTSTAVGHTGTGAASSITGTVSLLTLVDRVGANNSGFIDESTNNAVITRSGNVTQGSFSPFGTSGWSNYFKGSGDYLQLTGTSAFNMSTYGCLEAWVYLNSSGTNQLIAGRDSSYWIAYNFSGIGGVANKFVFTIYNGSSWQAVSSNISPSLGVWYHIVGIKDNTTLRIYINGIQENTATFSGSPNTPAGVIIGVAANQNTENLTGYISNVRFNIGSNSSILPYTSNFTPSTTPLTATTGTVLLTCQNNRFVDNSANNFAITVNGTPQVQPLSPFQPHTSVTNTYSNFFDGTNDYIQSTLPSTITGTFTIDFWWYRPASGVATIFNIGDSMSADSAEVYIGTNGTILKYYNNNNERITTSTLPTLSAWNYLAVTRDSSNVVRLYLNGTQVGGTYVQTGNLSTQLRIGCEYYNGAPAFAVGGYISNFRVSNIVRDVSSLPSAPFVSDANTLALTCQDSTFKDNSSYGSTVTVYDAPRCTEFNPLGRTFTTGVNYSATTHGSSAYFDGDVDHITTTTVNFSNQNYTIECWAYPTQLADGYLWQISNPSSGARGSSTVTGAWYSSTGKFIWFSAGGSFGGSSFDIVHSVTSPLNTWTHIALVRNGNTFTQYINGVAVGSATVNATYTSAGTAFSMGRYYGNSGDGNFYFKGYIANYRQINGTALYTSNFVPQLQPPQAVANTQLLLNFNNAGVVDYTGKNVLETVGDSRSVTSTKKSLLDATGSVYFDGTGDCLSVPLTPNLTLAASDFTLEFWLYWNSVTGQADIISNRNSGSIATGFVIYLGTGYISLAMSTDGSSWAFNTGTSFGWLSGTWYHVAMTRNQNNIRFFVDGAQVFTTTFSSSIYQNQPIYIGSSNGSNPLNGYLQDIRITKLARYTGTFTPPVRTFSATVRDVGHKQWVVNNLSVASGAGNDSLIDSPSNYGVDTGLGGEVRGNYCTLNPLWLSSSAPTLTNGNLDTTATNSSWNNSQGTFGISSGKWYWESTMSGDMFFQLGVGLREAINNVYSGSDVNSWTYDGRAFKNGNGSQPAYGATFAGGDIISVALDMDAGTLTFYKNGVSQGVAFSSGLAGKTVFPQFGCYQAGRSQSVNFGQRPFAYPAPSGYKVLCTQNLPAPSIVKPNTAFDALTYIGNGSTQTVSGLNFNPDLVWVKRRDGSGQDHVLQDVVRGFTSSTKLASSSQAAENNTGGGVTDPQWGYISATTSTGFTTTVGSGTGDQTNRTSWSYAGWVWDGGNNTVTNTTGTITSQVRSNPSAGFSIVGYTGAGGGTVGHGLNSAPQMMIVRDRNTLNDWVVYHEKVGNTKVLVLNNQNPAVAANSIYWNNTSPTSSVFTTGSGSNTGQSGRPYIAYCFTSIPGYSMISSYTGNGAGSTTGQFIYTGFRPRFILIKSDSNTTEWLMMDAARNTANVVNFRLDANSTGIEITANYLDFLSNGFRLVHPSNWMNDSGYSFIYAAFAENPFKYSLAR
jgi:hypothetical protein